MVSAHLLPFNWRSQIHLLERGCGGRWKVRSVRERFDWPGCQFVRWRLGVCSFRNASRSQDQSKVAIRVLGGAGRTRVGPSLQRESE